MRDPLALQDEDRVCPGVSLCHLHEAKIKKLFFKLQLQKVYEKYEEKVVGEIREKIAKVDEGHGLRKEVFE
jgi:hypothetical protein